MLTALHRRRELRFLVRNRDQCRGNLCLPAAAPCTPLTPIPGSEFRHTKWAVSAPVRVVGPVSTKISKIGEFQQPDPGSPKQRGAIGERGRAGLFYGRKQHTDKR